MRRAQAHVRRAAHYAHTDTRRASWHAQRARDLMPHGSSFGSNPTPTDVVVISDDDDEVEENGDARWSAPRAAAPIGDAHRSTQGPSAGAVALAENFDDDVRAIDAAHERVRDPPVAASGASKCAVCLENEPHFAPLQCGHLCMCGPCANAVLAESRPSCPICRGPVTSAELRRIYLAFGKNRRK